MKRFIKLLSILLCLLCAVLLLAACSEKDEAEETTLGDTAVLETVTQAETEPETEPDIHEYVEPLLGNFFDFAYAENWHTINPDTLKRLDADAIVVDSYPVLIYVKSDVNVKNTVTETFTVYNMELDKIVLEASHTYTNSKQYGSYIGDFVAFDKDGGPDVLYPESMMNVEVCMLGGTFSYLKVSTYEFTVVDETVREENPTGSYYDVKKTYEYYDLAGTHLTTANHEVSIDQVASDNFSTTYRFGTCNVTFDDETGLAISIADASGIKQFGKYDVENALYGYRLNRSTGTDFPKGFLEVYEKATGKLVQRYYYNPSADAVGAQVLRNGDILIQELVRLDEDSTVKPTFTYMNMDFTLATYILDAKTGESTAVEFNYVIYQLLSREDFIENFDLDQAGITPTENVVNVALVYPIDDKDQMRSDTPALLVLDNDLEIMFTLESIIPEQDMGRLTYGDLGIRALKDGHYLISLYTDAPARHVIVDAKGDIVTYVTEDMIIRDQYIITEDGIYNYKMELQFNFTANEYKLEGIIGHKVILSYEQAVSILDDAEDAGRYPYTDHPEDTYNAYCVIDLTADSLLVDSILDGNDNYYAIGEADEYVSDEYGNDYRIDITHYAQKTEIQRIADDYVITYDKETDKYTLWNADLTHVLTTDESMTITSLDEGRYAIITRVGGITLAYTVRA